MFFLNHIIANFIIFY